MTLEQFYGVLREMKDGYSVPVSHYHSDSKDFPRIVYFEYDEGSLNADNHRLASFDYVQISYFTQTDHDKNVKRIARLLNEHEIAYKKKTIYERENQVWHHVFDCSLL